MEHPTRQTNSTPTGCCLSPSDPHLNQSGRSDVYAPSLRLVRRDARATRFFTRRRATTSTGTVPAYTCFDPPGQRSSAVRMDNPYAESWWLYSMRCTFHLSRSSGGTLSHAVGQTTRPMH